MVEPFDREQIFRRVQIKRSGFTEEPIIGTIKRKEAAEKPDNIYIGPGIYQATFYKWKSKFGTMFTFLEVSHLRSKPTQVLPPI